MEKRRSHLEIANLEKLEEQEQKVEITQEFLMIYEHALLHNLWQEGKMTRAEYQWCLEELKKKPIKVR
ncbi:hypothetical protein [Anaerosporobacter faecicola]|uniref:hypothetical protein n=1 Tax=Anaerosporobacter faecicola TaxID=2718714 RepID=UPI0014399B2C|nr:hypothetical protein [Anaerosporobacter faecicola]